MRTQLCTGVVLALVTSGCPSSSRDSPQGSVTASAAPSPPLPSASSAPSACSPPDPTKLDNGRCVNDADCVLTDLPLECDACNLPSTYPTLKSQLAQRVLRCDAGAPTPCATATCPPRDTYTGAFYRAQCKDHRCIAWRYHSGG